MKSKLLHSLNVLLNFLPFQLIFMHLRKNLFSVFFWFALFAFVGGSGARFGVPQLFLSPEYMGEVDNISFLILGIGLGGFISAFNLYSYVLLGPLLPFLGTVQRPLIVFSINNSLIILIFLGFYFPKMFAFQQEQELRNLLDICYMAIYFLIGIFIFVFFSFLYFFNTNKNIFKLSGKSESEYETEFMANPVTSVLMKDDHWFYSFRKLKFSKHYYISERLRIKRSRYWQHFDKKLIEKVFYQNHVNTSFFEIFVIVSFIVFGIFGDNKFLVIPAGSSIFLIFSIVLMLISAVYSWFRSWTYLILATLVLVINWLSKNPNFEQYTYPAFGLNYESDLVQDKQDIFRKHLDSKRIDYEKKAYIEILNNWKSKQVKRKPKLVILNVSGGGSRSTLWSFLVMRQLDSLTQGDFSNSIQMITGASGGMLGAAYYRELYLRSLSSDTLNLLDNRYLENASKELLNGLATAITTRDIFFKYSKFEYNGRYYLKDRSHAFELQWHRNTDFITEKTLEAYEADERSAKIPVMVFSPTLINDGRRLLISSVETGFYQSAYQVNVDDYTAGVEDLEYSILMGEFDHEKTRFSSVLRMSATFPYILPMTRLPGNLDYHVMDAGIRDNQGTKTTLKFLFAFEDWIAKNTSGVLIVRVRDVMRHSTKNTDSNFGILDKLFLPLGNMLSNLLTLQDYEQDDQLSLVTDNYKVPINVISFDLQETKNNNIALSFRLTNYEKRKVKNTLKAERNQKSFYNVLRILDKL